MAPRQARIRGPDQEDAAVPQPPGPGVRELLGAYVEHRPRIFLEPHSAAGYATSAMTASCSYC